MNRGAPMTFGAGCVFLKLLICCCFYMYAFIFSVMKKRTKKMPGLRILKPAVASDGIILMVLPVKRLFKMCGPVKNYPFHHRPPLKIHYAGGVKP